MNYQFSKFDLLTSSHAVIFTSLSKNSATLYTYENTNVSFNYPRLNFQEVIDENLAYINGSNENSTMFGSTILFKGGSTNNLLMLYAKDITNDGDVVTVVTIVDEKVNRTMAFTILNDILVAFSQENANQTDNESELLNGYNNNNNITDKPMASGTNSFKLKMKDIIENPSYRSLDQYGSVYLANEEIDQVRTLMNDSIERVLQRGERIHLLVNKTDKLNNASNSFRRRTVAIKRRLWWGNVRFMVILIFCGLVLLYLVVGEFCGFPIYNKCFRYDDGN